MSQTFGNCTKLKNIYLENTKNWKISQNSNFDIEVASSELEYS